MGNYVWPYVRCACMYCTYLAEEMKKGVESFQFPCFPLDMRMMRHKHKAHLKGVKHKLQGHKLQEQKLVNTYITISFI